MKKLVLTFCILLASSWASANAPESISAANDNIVGASVGAIGAENCDNCELPRQSTVALSDNTNPGPKSHRWQFLLPESSEAGSTPAATQDGTN